MASTSPGIITPDSCTNIQTLAHWHTGTLSWCHDVTSLRQHNINNHPNVSCQQQVWCRSVLTILVPEISRRWKYSQFLVQIVSVADPHPAWWCFFLVLVFWFRAIGNWALVGFLFWNSTSSTLRRSNSRHWMSEKMGCSKNCDHQLADPFYGVGGGWGWLGTGGW